jgi:hypothetical protein
MNIAKDFDWSFKLNEWFFVFKTFLNLLDEELNHFVGKVDEWHTLGILASVTDDVMVQVVDDNIHDEHNFIVQILLWNSSDCFFECLAPLFLNVKRFHVVLLRLEIFVEQCLKFLTVCLFC